MATVQSGELGPAWTDVRVAMQEVGASHNLRLDIHCSAAQGANRADMLVWTVRAWQWGKWGEGNPYAMTTGLYPSNQYRTVPAMLYGLVMRLDYEITAIREKKARLQQRTF